jgi:hypothetical protein
VVTQGKEIVKKLESWEKLSRCYQLWKQAQRWIFAN